MAYPKSVPPIKSLYQLILEDIEKPLQNQMDSIQELMVIQSKLSAQEAMT